MSRFQVFISAGEASGDLHAANLVRAVRKVSSEVRFIGLGGDKMKEAGVDLRAQTVHMGTVGFLEGIKFYPAFFNLLSMVKRILRKERPDLAVLVNSRDFNLRVAKLARKLGITTLYYVAPPVWAWNDWKKKTIAKTIDKIIAIFAFEAKVYQEAGANVELVGYPLLDLVKPSMSKEEAFSKLDLDPARPIIGFLPGSRGHEINQLLPIMLKSARKIKDEMHHVQFLLPVAAPVFQDRIVRQVKRSGLPIKVFSNNIYDLMNIADLLMVTSGTATLEAALLGTPMIIVYKTSLSTYLLGRILVKLPYIGLPNIIAERKIVPEFVGFRMRENKITDEALRLLNSPGERKKMREDLGELKKKLGEPGVLYRAARIVVETLDTIT